MFKINGFFSSFLLVLTPFLSSVHAAELNWSSCGDSNKAYVANLAKVYETQAGIHINIISQGFADIGESCRYMSPDEPREAGIGLEPVAWDALVFIVHKDNPVDSISIKQAQAIYRGEITNWKQIGGNDQKIEIFTRKSLHSGIGRTLRKQLFDNYNQVLASNKTFTSTESLEQAIMDNPLAFGTSSVSSARQSESKILKLDGIEPSVGNVQTGKYELYRPLYLTYNEHSPNINEVRNFVSFIHSTAGREVMRNSGVVPYNEALILVMKQVKQDQAAFNKELKL